MGVKKPKHRKRKIWKKGLKASWSKGAHRHTKLENQISRESIVE